MEDKCTFMTDQTQLISIPCSDIDNMKCWCHKDSDGSEQCSKPKSKPCRVNYNRVQFTNIYDRYRTYLELPSDHGHVYYCSVQAERAIEHANIGNEPHTWRTDSLRHID